TSETGPKGRFDAVINAMGNQHTPLYPEVEGRDAFAGDSWHSTLWNHDVDLTGKRVVVVGSAAAAVQIVPEVAKLAGHLTVLQRSPNWIMPRRRKVYSDAQRRRFRRFPWLIGATRAVQGLMMGQVAHAVTLGHKRMDQFESMVKKYINDTVEDPELRAALIPDSRYGCKRGLVSDDFYPALNRDNVDLVPQGLARVTPGGVVTSDGREIAADVIIYCTGYRILDYDRITVTGREGRSLADTMGADQRSHKGICVPGFPNYFFAVGPNGLVLNVSYFITLERNVETIVGLLREVRDAGAHSLEVKQQAFDDYNAWMDQRFSKFSWGNTSCSSYYINASGHAPFLFPGTFKEYRKLHQAIGLDEFNVA
ncbi:MAG: NAD(P)/FAD-dependent oxidoreductase, partial [Halioglobus sp.]|nr:NAD(P)/FAD-dependent oxidoreductase [Halioglobus sp.]